MFSASDAAFSGFRAGREHFRTLLTWIPILGLLSFGMIAAMVQFAGPGLTALAQTTPDANPDPQAAMAALRPLGALYMVLIPYSLVFYAVLYAAVNRMMLRPSDRRFAWLAFGADEFRQMAVMILLSLLFFGVYLVGVVAVVILAAVGGSAGTGAGIFAGIAGGLALVSVMVVLAVRLSLASAQTYATGKINLFGSWALTRGHFWPMLGAYLLSLVLALIAYLAVYAILMLVVITVGGGFSAVSNIVSPDMSSLQAYFTPTTLIYQLLAMIPAPFLLLIMLCPAPEIYRRLSGGTGLDEAFA